MRDSCKRVRTTIATLAVAGVFTISPASAQDESGNPFLLLKPWIERQLFGSETTEAAPEAVDPAAGADSDIPAEAAEGAVPAEDTATGLSAEENAAAEAAPPATQPDPATAAIPEAPPVDVAGTEPGAPDAQSGEAAAIPTEPPKPAALRFAVLAGRSIAGTMAAVGSVAEELQALLGRPVEILPLNSYAAMVDAQVQQRIDGGFYSAAAFAAAEASCHCLEPLVAPRASDGTLAYHAVIVARASAGIASVADLAGKTVAVGSADSIGSRRMQLAGLLSEGIDPTSFGAVIEVGSAENAVTLVEAGAADAAFAWSSLAGSAEAGYSRGTLADLAASGGASTDTLAIIWRSPPIAHGPFAVTSALAEADKSTIEKYLVALTAENPVAYDMLNPFYGGGYAPVDPQDYSGLETLLVENVDAIRLPGAPATTGATTIAPSDEATEAPAPVAPN